MILCCLLDVGSFIWGESGRQDNIEVMPVEVVSLREMPKFLNISRGVIRERP